MPNEFEQERERVIEIAKAHPQPCMVCDFHEVAGIGTWIPDARHYLAAGGTNDVVPIFAFWLCREHSDGSEENQKLIRQAVLRSVR